MKKYHDYIHAQGWICNFCDTMNRVSITGDECVRCKKQRVPKGSGRYLRNKYYKKLDGSKIKLTRKYDIILLK